MEEPMTNSAEVVPLLVDLKREMDGTQLPTDVLEDEVREHVHVTLYYPINQQFPMNEKSRGQQNP
jgi:hypothetical protein